MADGSLSRSLARSCALFLCTYVLLDVSVVGRRGGNGWQESRDRLSVNRPKLGGNQSAHMSDSSNEAMLVLGQDASMRDMSFNLVIDEPENGSHLFLHDPDLSNSNTIIVVVASVLISLIIFSMDYVFGITGDAASTWRGIIGFIYKLDLF